MQSKIHTKFDSHKVRSFLVNRYKKAVSYDSKAIPLHGKLISCHDKYLAYPAIPFQLINYLSRKTAFMQFYIMQYHRAMLNFYKMNYSKAYTSQTIT